MAGEETGNSNYITHAPHITDDVGITTTMYLSQEKDLTESLVVFNNESKNTTVTKPVVGHACFSVLLGRVKCTIGTKNNRAKIIYGVLKVNVSEYVPPHLTNDPLIKE